MRSTLSLILLLCCHSFASRGQAVATGRVAGRDSLPLAGASIKNMQTGALSISGPDGAFRIGAAPGDTLLFTAIGYIPLGIAAGRLPPVLQLRTQITQLPGIEVRRRTYTADSLALREEYRKQFGFRRPKWNEVAIITPVGIGVNIHKLYKALSFKNNKRSDEFKARLLRHEQQLFIDQRFTTALVSRFTGLSGDSLARFMNVHRPAFEFTRDAPDYDFIRYIREAGVRFRQTVP